MKTILLFAAFLALTPVTASAQGVPGYGDPSSFSMRNPVPDPAHPGQWVDTPPLAEPHLPKVEYINPEPPTSLRERVDMLLHAIKVDVPPEYDVYGYELRRYMVSVGNPAVFTSEERRLQELKNIGKAKIIHKYWRDAMIKEIKDIEVEIEKQNPPTDVRTTFKYNSGLVMAFFGECQTWMVKNEEVLEFLEKTKKHYRFEDPVITFEDKADRSAFVARYNAARQAQKYMNEYVPFAVMIY